MTNPDWPKYDAGPAPHLHALGVISSAYNDFKSGLLRLYCHHLDRKKIPEKVSARLYLHASEDQRPELLKFIFAEHEKNPKVREAVAALCTYFLWCWKSRNTLLHANIIPTLIRFGPGQVGDRAPMMIAKRLTKKGLERGIATITLGQLRYVADQIHIGDKRCTNLHWYLMRRDIPKEKQSELLRMSKRQSLPEIPAPPKEISLWALPRSYQKPPQRQQASPRKS
jgi:hypothetical protein